MMCYYCRHICVSHSFLHQIKMSNSVEYGLGSSVFTGSYSRGNRVASQLDCGQVAINDFATVPLIQSLPFGGCKVRQHPPPSLSLVVS